MTLVTLPAVSEKLAEVAAWATVTVAGTLPAAGLELESVTTIPPAGAGAVSVTVTVPAWPLIIVLGVIVTLLSAGGGGLIVTLAVLLTPE